MTTLKQGERTEQRVVDHRVVFEGCGHPQFDITSGELVRRLQEGGDIQPGTLVRLAHFDDGRSWFEVVRVLEVHAPAAA